MDTLNNKGQTLNVLTTDIVQKLKRSWKIKSLSKAQSKANKQVSQLGIFKASKIQSGYN